LSLLQNNTSQNVQTPPEYTVYAYNASGNNRWKRLMSGADIGSVMKQAEQLFQSKKYNKIEIQKKYFDKKKGCITAAPFRVFETKSKDNYMIMASILLLALTSIGLFYLQFS
tara:strand:+ start:27 stop:362 length:336 start_codon:yes stop_codon:yes gene_type:complete